MSTYDDVAIVDSDGENEFAYVSRGQHKLANRVLRSTPALSSRRSFNRRDSSPSPVLQSSSSASLISSKPSTTKRNSVATLDDSEVSPLDPRRFTPTLHASLVSEILSLRRELESRTTTIEGLESSLDSTRNESEWYCKSLAKATKDARALQSQLTLVEGGTNTAVEELTKERDEALENAGDLRSKLDAAHQKLRSQEEDNEKIRQGWERERQRWDEDRRDLERKVHVTEARLKTVLSEFMSRQSAPEPADSANVSDFGSSERTVRGSDSGSVRSGSPGPEDNRRESIASMGTYEEARNVRFSMDSMDGGSPAMNLADELALDEEGFDDYRPESQATAYDLRPLSMLSKRSLNRNSVRFSTDTAFRGDASDILARLRNIDTVTEDEAPQSPAPCEYKDAGVQWTPPPSPKPPVAEKQPEKPKFEYKDAGVQNERPPSPPLTASSGVSEDSTIEHEETSTSEPPPQYRDAGSQSESVSSLSNAQCQTVEIHDSAPVEVVKGPATSTDPVHVAVADRGTSPRVVPTASCDCQTSDDLLDSLLETHLKKKASFQEELNRFRSQEVTSSVAVQTDDLPSKDASKSSTYTRDEEKVPFEIPVIAIHPPGSNPPTPRSSVVLPPHTKSVSCQADPADFVDTCSTAVQTEPIRINDRLPKKLLPSAIPASPEEDTLAAPEVAPFPPPKSPRRRLYQLIRASEKPRQETAATSPASSEASKDTAQVYANDDDGEKPADNVKVEVRPPSRSSSLFAGFSGKEGRDADNDEFDDFMDDEAAEPPSIPHEVFEDSPPFGIPSTLPSTHNPHQLEKLDEEENEDDEVLSRASFVSEMPMGTLRRTRTPAKSNAKKPSRQLLLENSLRSANASGAADVSRGGDTSAPPPPFPVPDRGSSRKKIRPTVSSRALGPSRELSSSPPPIPSFNYDRSAAPSPEVKSSRTRSPSPFGEDLRGPISRATLKEPMKRIRATGAVSRAAKGRTRGLSGGEDIPSASSSVAPSVSLNPRSSARNEARSRIESKEDVSHPQTSVVDAIAQTMVGEWMWKYVRRRKSFTMSENRDDSGRPGDEAGNGSRHKRWVWLAPYERTVMWSSKQPTNGTALLGKGGRKLPIQSVLDVKDDNPLPRGANPETHFGRSIVILTPERALKFTAMTLERHHIWLSALSFLSHPAVGMNDLAAIPPIPQEEVKPKPAPTLRRNPIRDSIRVAKGKRLGRFGKSAANSTTMLDEGEEDIGAMTTIEDAASPPSVPRFAHNRKRSVTQPQRPDTGRLRSYSPIALGGQGSPTGFAPADIFSIPDSRSPAQINEASGPIPMPSTREFRTASPNFFDALGNGMVRMEAFVDDRPDSSRTRASRNRSRRNKLDMIVWTAATDSEYPENGESEPESPSRVLRTGDSL